MIPQYSQPQVYQINYLGNTIYENTFCLEAFRLGYKEFILQNSYPTSLSHYAAPKSSFKLVITIQKDTESEQYIRNYLSKHEFETDYVVVTNEDNEHFDAICVSYFKLNYSRLLTSDMFIMDKWLVVLPLYT